MTKQSPTQDKQNTNTALQKIRPELNLEKWTIWKPSKSPAKELKAQIIKRDIVLDDGSRVKSKVKVGFTDDGQLTTEDRKTYYALIKMWYDKGRPTEQVFLSLRQLAKILNKKWGSNVIEATSQSLLRLRTIPFTWENSYFNASTGETEEILTAFNILSDLKIHKAKKHGHTTKEAGYFKFNDHILNNLLANYTKPLLLDVILNFKSEIAQLLYTYLDLIMADKICYERRSEGLFQDLGLEGKSYKNPSKRKQNLINPLKELQGVQLTTGILTEARIEQTKDEKDFKLVFRKQPQKTIGERATEQPLESQTSFTEPEPKAVELVKYFHGKLKRPDHQPSSKELDQATSLIADCDFEPAKYLINYALKEAEKTNFQMRTFGAILQYKQEGLKRYKQRKKQQETVEATQVRQRQLEEQAKNELEKEEKELEGYYSQLSDTDKQHIDQFVEQEMKKTKLDPVKNQIFYDGCKKHIRNRTLKNFKNNPVHQS